MLAAAARARSWALGKRSALARRSPHYSARRKPVPRATAHKPPGSAPGAAASVVPSFAAAHGALTLGRCLWVARAGLASVPGFRSEPALGVFPVLSLPFRVLGLAVFAFLLVRAALASVVWGPAPRGGRRPSLSVAGSGLPAAAALLGLLVLAVWGLWRVLRAVFWRFPLWVSSLLRRWAWCVRRCGVRLPFLCWCLFWFFPRWLALAAASVLWARFGGWGPVPRSAPWFLRPLVRWAGGVVWAARGRASGA